MDPVSEAVPSAGEPTHAHPTPAAAPEGQQSAAPGLLKKNRNDRTSRKKKKLGRKVAKFFMAKEAGRVAYAEADRLLDEIASEIKPGTEIAMYDKKGDPARPVRFIDLFAEKNVVFKPCGVRRFDLVPVK